MFDTRTRLFFFACLKDAAGAALKNAAPTKKKIGSGAALKVAAPGGSGSTTLVYRYSFVDPDDFCLDPSVLTGKLSFFLKLSYLEFVLVKFRLI